MEMTTLVAVLGPLLKTTMVKSTKPFAAAVGGPLVVTLRSATPVAEIGVTAVAELFEVFDSGDEVLTLAVFEIDEPA